ncbi:unnamed protein product [Closterium sp. Naga37s-1]|nr:unnamed protein product [Closterium sp. Naga37s-1]
MRNDDNLANIDEAGCASDSGNQNLAFPPAFSPFPPKFPTLPPSVAEFLKVGPPIFSALALSYGIWLAARAQPFGGETPRTMTREWIQASDKLLDAWPREAGSPVVMNPISRQNAIKN